MLYLWSQRKRQGKAMMYYLLIYVTILLFLESLFVAAGAWTVQGMYINHRNYPGGPWAYFLTTQNLPETVVLFASLLVLTFLSDLLVLWRCWVIWGSSGRLVACAVIAFPTAVLLASFALGTIWILGSTQPGSLHISVPMAFGTAYYVTSLGVNILVTILITIRLVLYRRSIMDTLPPERAAQYLSADTIIIESAALYSIFALGFIVSYSVNNPMNRIFMSLASTCQQIAGYLIILRLAQGRAWDSSTLTTKVPTSEPQLTTVQFSTPTTTTQFGFDQDLMDIEAQRDPFSSKHIKPCTVRG